jgi:hypothetical protein
MWFRAAFEINARRDGISVDARAAFAGVYRDAYDKYIRDLNRRCCGGYPLHRRARSAVTEVTAVQSWQSELRAVHLIVEVLRIERARRSNDSNDH